MLVFDVESVDADVDGHYVRFGGRIIRCEEIVGKNCIDLVIAFGISIRVKDSTKARLIGMGDF